MYRIKQYKNIHLAKNLFEVNFKVPTEKLNYLKTKIKNNCLTPKDFPGAKLKTLYFDDQFDTSFYESANGELKKTKYRFREYISPAKGGALYSLEIKFRNNSETSKIKKLIYNPLSKGFEHSTFRNLLLEIEKTNKIDLNDFYKYLPERNLFPSTLIQYERNRFDSIEGNVRYNIDTNITSTLGSRNFLNSEQKLYLKYSIFEIKSFYPEFFPSFLKNLKLEPSSFSKFAWGKETVDKVIN